MKTKLRKMLVGILVLVLVSADICALADTLAAIQLPQALKIIEEEAFYGDTSIEKIVVPDGATEIRSKAFAESSLKEINLPGSITHIENDAFDGCGKIVMTAEMDSYAYEWAIEHGYIERSVIESAHPYALNTDQTWEYNHPEPAVALIVRFSEQTKFEPSYDTLTVTDSTGAQSVYTGTELAGAELVLPGSSFSVHLKTDGSINEFGFRIISVEGMQTPSAPSGVTAAAQGASSIRISWNKVDGVDGYNVYRSASSGDIYSMVGTTGALSYTDTGLSANTMYYYKVTAYKRNVESSGSDYVSAKTMSMEEMYAATLTTRTLSDGTLEIIGYDDSLNELVIPATINGKQVTSIGEKAFADCVTLTTVVLPEGITSISKDSFKNCVNLGNVDLSSTLTSIGVDAFAGCTSLTEITIPECVVSIGIGAFSGCNSLTVTVVFDSHAYYWCIENSVPYNATDIIVPVPENVSAIALSGTEIEISWDEVENPDGYYIYTYADDPRIGRDIEAAEILVTRDRMSFVKENLSPGTTYYFRVSAYIGEIESELSEVVFATTWYALPESDHPYANDTDKTWEYVHHESAETLKVTFSSETELENRYDTLTVIDSNGNEDVYTGTELAGAELILPGNSFSLHLETDSSVQRYGFKVASVEVINGVLLPAPENVSAVALSNTAIEISWDEVENAEGYYIHTYMDDPRLSRSVEAAETFVTRDRKSYIKEDLSSGLTYYFRVGAFIYEKIEGELSEVVFATTLIVLPESDHPYADNTDTTWEYVHPEPAVSLKVSFSSDTEFESRYDTLTVIDTNGNESLYTGLSLAGVELNLPGNSFSLRLRTDGSRQYYGFKVISVEALDSPALSAPQNVRTTALGSTSIEIRWDEVEGADGYCLYSYTYNPSLSRNAEAAERFIVRDTEGVLIEDLAPRTTYYYRISACKEDGIESMQSEVVSATTLAVLPESDHPYASDTDKTWEYVHHEPAEALKVTFSSDTKFENRYDTLTVIDSYGNEDVYTGTELAGAELILPGNSFSLRLVTDLSVQEYGFRIISVEAVSGVLLPAPENVSAVALSSTAIRISWDEVENAEGYSVYTYDDDPRLSRDIEAEEIYIPRDRMSFDKENLSPATTYYFRVSANTGEIEGELSEVASATTWLVTLPESDHPYANNTDRIWEYVHYEPAEALKVTFSSDTEFEDRYDTLTVIDFNGTEEVYTGTELAGAELILPGNSFSLHLKTDYSYQYYGFKVISVEAVDADFLLAPQNVCASVLSTSSINVSWNNVSGAAYYYVYRSETDESSYTRIAVLSSESSSYTDTGLKSNTLYWYKVCAADANESAGPFGASVSARTSSNANDVTYRALLIGNTYPDTSNYLPGPDNDAMAVKTMLLMQHGTPFTVTTKINATASTIRSSITSALGEADSNDVSLFYYSGHGTSSGSLCGINDTYISVDNLRSYLDTIKGTKIVLLDSCHSGTHIGKSVDTSGAEDFNNAIIAAFSMKSKANLAANNYIVLTACSQNQYSYSSGLASGFYFGIFTNALARGSGYDMISGVPCSYYADTNNDGSITLGEEYNYIVNKIRQDHNNKQATQYYGDLGYVLWKYR